MSSVPLPRAIPVDIGRDEARDLAQRELLDPVYTNAEPPWWQQAASWVLDRISAVLDRVGDAAGSLLWLAVLAAVAALIAFVIVRRTGGIQRSRGSRGEVFAATILTADDHRSLADDAAARQDWSAAVRESFRAIVRQLEERGALDTRPGRTADEAARDAGAVFVGLRIDLDRAARTFDEVVYGERAATPDEFEAMSDLDHRLASTTQVAH